jgi:hypothetical protein
MVEVGKILLDEGRVFQLEALDFDYDQRGA